VKAVAASLTVFGAGWPSPPALGQARTAICGDRPCVASRSCLDVDDDPKQMDVALTELKVRVPSVAARNFAYSLVPEMALPSNWILTPSKTEMLTEPASSLEVWLENTAKAIEKAATK